MFLLPKNAWEIKKSEKKGKGVFVKKDIAPGVVIGDYLGKIIHPIDEDKYDSSKHFYSMYYHDKASVFPDLKKPGVQLLNHSCTPNCWMYTYKGHTLYFTLRRIFSGEELTVSYLLSSQDKFCNPCSHLCHCDGVICFQTMHLSDKRYNAWEKIHDEQAAKTKRERVKFDQELQKLSSYPQNIPDNPIYTLFGAKETNAVSVVDKKVPSQADIRKIIRETGRTIFLPEPNLRIHGVLDNLLISEVLA